MEQGTSRLLGSPGCIKSSLPAALSGNRRRTFFRLFPVFGLSAGLILFLNGCKQTPFSTIPPDPEQEQVPEVAALPDIQSILDDLGGVHCLDGSFTCVNLVVPLDHAALDNDKTIEVAFAVHPSSGERKGMLVIVVGGPGGSGLAVADWYIWGYDPSITEQFDIVFFDQRGVGASGELRCDNAASNAYLDNLDPTIGEGSAENQLGADVGSSEGEELMLSEYEALAQDCVNELASTDLLPYVGTDQAIEDLEIFRKAIGDEQIWLYGESYGTQFAQAYTAAHGEHVAELILDGPVDPNLPPLEFLAEQTQAFNDVLVMTLEACNADYFCRDDMGEDALEAYDDLAARLAESPMLFEFPLASGGIEERYFSLSDLESSVAQYLYSEGARMIFLRSLAAAVARNDLVPMARMLYEALDIDPNTIMPEYDPTFSSAAFYAIECSDPGLRSTETYLQAGKDVENSTLRLSSVFYGNLVCPYWPVDPSVGPVSTPLVAQGIPTLVMVGTADPATPPANAERIMEHLADGYLILEDGGPHVLYGWGKPCIDSLVTEFLVEGNMPAHRRTTCEGVVVSEYFNLPPLDASEFNSPLEALWSADIELNFIPQFYYWDGESDLEIGCPSGGSISIKPTYNDYLYLLENCVFTPGLAMTGSGFYDFYEGNFNLDLVISGYQEGHLYYSRDYDWSLLLTGEYAGREIRLTG